MSSGSKYLAAKKYYCNLISFLPCCNDVGFIILEYVMDLWLASKREQVLDYIRNSCVIYQEDMDRVHSLCVPRFICDRIFNPGCSILNTLLCFPDGHLRHRTLLAMLEDKWKLICDTYKKENTKMIALSNWKITFDSVDIRGIPMIQDTYLVFDSMHTDYLHNLGVFALNPRCIR